MSKLPILEYVSWKELERLCFELALLIEKDGQKYDKIVSISRGGHVVSRVLSDLLDLTIYNVSIQSYKTMAQERLEMTQKLNVFLESERVLLVDEIVDTGYSLKRALEYLRRVRCKLVKSAVLHVKPKAILRPDFFVRETDKWVIYPYEVRESYKALVSLGAIDGVGENEVKDKLVQLGMEQERVDWVSRLEEESGN